MSREGLVIFKSGGMLPPETGHYIDSQGDEVYTVARRYHRDDGPAIITKAGSKEWIQHGRTHRLDGPAIEYANGHVKWYIDSIQYKFDGFVIKAEWTDEQIIEYKLKNNT